MASIFDLETTLSILRRIEKDLQNAIQRVETVQEFFLDQISLGTNNIISLEGSINTNLSGLNTLIGTRIVGAATSIAVSVEIWAVQLTQSYMFDRLQWKSTSVDVDDGASGSTLTINQDITSDIFGALDVGDIVNITKAEDPNHNGRYTIAASTSTVLTFNATMLGKDNANDETMVITLVER